MNVTALSLSLQMYGMVVDQLGSRSEPVSGIGSPVTVSQFMVNVFGYEYDFRGWYGKPS